MGSSTDLIAQHVEYVQQDQKRETVLDCVKMVDVSTVHSIFSTWACVSWFGCCKGLGTSMYVVRCPWDRCLWWENMCPAMLSARVIS